MIGRYTHAHQFRRARKALKFLRTRLGRVIRDIRRKIDGNPELEARFAPLLDLAVKVRLQDHRQRGPKVYSLHAPEVECIGKGKARAPYEFGCKVSVATPVIGHLKAEHRMHRNYLKGRDGDRINAVLAAAGYNFSLLLRWLQRLLRALIQALADTLTLPLTA